MFWVKSIMHHHCNMCIWKLRSIHLTYWACANSSSRETIKQAFNVFAHIRTKVTVYLGSYDHITFIFQEHVDNNKTGNRQHFLLSTFSINQVQNTDIVFQYISTIFYSVSCLCLSSCSHTTALLFNKNMYRFNDVVLYIRQLVFSL